MATMLHSSKWMVAGVGETDNISSDRTYRHPDSPVPGHTLMSQALSFERVKLTNCSKATSGQVCIIHRLTDEQTLRSLALAPSTLPPIHPATPSCPVIFSHPLIQLPTHPPIHQSIHPPHSPTRSSIHAH